MGTNIDFKDLWQKQTISQPNIEDVYSKLKQYKTAGRRSLIKLNVLLLSTIAFIIFIWYYFQPQFITTKVGIILVIVAIMIFIFSNNKLFSVFNKIDNSLSNHEYLANLITLKSKQQFLQTTMLKLYFIILSAGLCLYLYEYTSKMTTIGAIVAYAVTAAWIIFNWLYIRPKAIKKHQAKLNELITKFERISGQLKNE